MRKLQSLKDHMTAALQHRGAASNPADLYFHIPQGSLQATQRLGLGFGYSYTLVLTVLDFAHSIDEIMVPLLLWIRRWQPELLALTADRGGIAFEVEDLDDGKVDVMIRVPVSWTRRGDYLIGFDREADGIRTFRADRKVRDLPAEGGPDPGALPSSIRGRRGGVKRKAAAMFSKLRTVAHLKAGATPGEAYVEFTARASRLARIHHFGLKDRVVPDGPETQYPQRELLGFSQADDEAILALIAEDLGFE